MSHGYAQLKCRILVNSAVCSLQAIATCTDQVFNLVSSTAVQVPAKPLRSATCGSWKRTAQPLKSSNIKMEMFSPSTTRIDQSGDLCVQYIAIRL